MTRKMIFCFFGLLVTNYALALDMPVGFGFSCKDFSLHGSVSQMTITTQSATLDHSPSIASNYEFNEGCLLIKKYEHLTSHVHQYRFVNGQFRSSESFYLDAKGTKNNLIQYVAEKFDSKSRPVQIEGKKFLTQDLINFLSGQSRTTLSYEGNEQIQKEFSLNQSASQWKMIRKKTIIFEPDHQFKRQMIDQQPKLFHPNQWTDRVEVYDRSYLMKVTHDQGFRRFVYEDDLLIQELSMRGRAEDQMKQEQAIEYTNYVLDSCGNWTSRLMVLRNTVTTETESVRETREIKYHSPCVR